MQNLELANQTNPIITATAYIEQILNQLLIDYQNTQPEREKIAQWEENQEFSILGIIEVLTDEIRGYAFQIISNKLLAEPQKIINRLNTLKIFEVSELTTWYFSSKQDYPKIKYYVETLNYLRLLIIEYIRDQETS
jgi:hypothetical protein